MRISTKGRYALRLMLDLAMEENGKPVSIKDIAGRQGISEKYLEQIISSLNKAGYVKSVRGAQGGYLLKMEPKDYTVGMILRVTEGSLAPVDCAEDGSCERISSCATAMLWKKVSRSSLTKAVGYRENLYLAVFFIYWTGFEKHAMISPQTDRNSSKVKYRF